VAPSTDSTIRHTCVSFATRLLAKELKATNRPSRLTAICSTEEPDEVNPLLSFPCVPSLATLTRVVSPLTRSRTKTSAEKFVSPATRFPANDTNTIVRPSPLSSGRVEFPWASRPLLETLTRVIWAPAGVVTAAVSRQAAAIVRSRWWDTGGRRGARGSELPVHTVPTPE
jgi:hypothetical protein